MMNNKKNMMKFLNQFEDEDFYTLDQIASMTGFSQTTIWRIRKKYGSQEIRFKKKLLVGRDIKILLNQHLNRLD